ncbi:MAG: hypothetical protein HZB40_16220 [Rhodocyclales bacterium]|nr:hypothetical protein [Rhodocyclales bacterium]
MGQVYGSVEAQHQKTILLDFIDHIADYDRFGRAEQLFSPERAIGIPLSAIRAIGELPQAVRDRLYFVKFEDLMSDPVGTMTQVFKWLNLTPHKVDPKKLTVRAHESDSHYRHKFLHRQHDDIVPPKGHAIPTRIQLHIEQSFGWYYDQFYPQLPEK